MQGPGEWLKAACSSEAVHGVMGAPMMALSDWSRGSVSTTGGGGGLEDRGAGPGETVFEPTASGGGKVGEVDGATPGVFALREQLRHIVNLQVLHCQASDPFFKEWPPFQQGEMWGRA